MTDVFEKEGSPTQDASYREHLNRNWEAGNRKFAELEGKFKNTEEKYQGVIVGQDSNDADIKKKEEQIKALEIQVAKLSLAVFGDRASAVSIDSQNDMNDVVFGDGASAVSIDSQNDMSDIKKAKGISIDYDNDKR